MSLLQCCTFHHLCIRLQSSFCISFFPSQLAIQASEAVNCDCFIVLTHRADILPILLCHIFCIVWYLSLRSVFYCLSCSMYIVHGILWLPCHWYFYCQGNAAINRMGHVKAQMNLSSLMSMTTIQQVLYLSSLQISIIYWPLSHEIEMLITFVFILHKHNFITSV